MLSLTALADPTRRRIVELLAERDRTAGELVDEFDVSAPAISQHLNVLRDAGLVTTRAEGPSRIQALNPAGLDEIHAWLDRTRAFWSRRLDALERELKAEDAAASSRGRRRVSRVGPRRKKADRNQVEKEND
jgi:DNA-binding transcriptional ArsR family regulator